MHKTQAFVRVFSIWLNAKSVGICKSVGFFEMAMLKTTGFTSLFTNLEYFLIHFVARKCKKRQVL